MSREAYRARYPWSEAQLQVIRQAVETRDASVPYRLAREILAEHRWAAQKKSVCHQIVKAKGAVSC